MKISSLALALLASTPLARAALECTHGKLFALDDTTSDVHVFDVSAGNFDAAVVEETTLTLPTAGAGSLTVYGPPGDPLIIQYRGDPTSNTTQFGAGSFVRAINPGFHGDHYDPPTIVDESLVDLEGCIRPVHQVRHNNQIAIFCDGNYGVSTDPTVTDQKNTTIFVLDADKIESGQDAVEFSVTIEGAHHGVAIPVDDGHLMHSVALPGRIAREAGVTSLPLAFRMWDYTNDQVVHELNDESDPALHCGNFHGSASVDNTFALGCDQDHGAIVIVQYDPATETYSSKALNYPDEPEFENFSVGSFAYHYKSPIYVGSFTVRRCQDCTDFHLLAVDYNADTVTKENVLTLPGDKPQCSYQFEVGQGKYLLVWMPDGVLHAFTVTDGKFESVAQTTVVEGMTECNQAAFTAGIESAFVATKSPQKLYTIDLTQLDAAKTMTVHESDLDFVPTVLTVSGFTLEEACVTEAPTPGSGAVSAMYGGVVALVASMALVLM